LRDKIKVIENKISILTLLEKIHVSSTQFEAARNLILHIESDGSLKVFGYSKTKPALEKYFELEETGKLDDLVFVRSDSSEGIRSAFRNYFTDARDFTRLVRAALITSNN
jgi:putative GTP pyrophosphokinase